MLSPVSRINTTSMTYESPFRCELRCCREKMSFSIGFADDRQERPRYPAKRLTRLL